MLIRRIQNDNCQSHTLYTGLVWVYEVANSVIYCACTDHTLHPSRGSHREADQLTPLSHDSVHAIKMAASQR